MRIQRHFNRVTVMGAVIIAAIAGAYADEMIGDRAADLPLFDAHVHYKEPAWGPYPVSTVLTMMDKSGVAMALVSSTPDDGTIMLLDYAPNRIVPELRPYHGDAGSGNWTKADDMLDYMKARMAKYPHRGIGEFHLHRVDVADRSFLRDVANLALEHQALIHVHSGAAPVDLLFELAPELTIIWAHAGMSEPPGVVGPMMDKYPKLFADTSYREHDIMGPDGTIDPAWRDLLIRHADRFMIGSDTWVNSQWADYENIIAFNRRWLSRFPGSVAEAIAYKNAEALLGISVNRSLIGQR